MLHNATLKSHETHSLHTAAVAASPRSQFQGSKTLQGILWMLLWGMTFTTSMSLAKLIHPDVPSTMIVFLRCFFGWLLFLPFAAQELRQKGIQHFRPQQPWIYLIRILVVAAAMACTYYAYRNLPLATASAIGFSSPLFTVVLSALFLKDRIQWKQGCFIILGYIGVLIIIGPVSLSFDSAASVALLANFLASCAIVLLKQLCKTEDNIKILLYTNTATFILSGIAACFMWHSLSGWDLGLLLLIGMSSSLTQWFYTQALRISDPHFVAPFEYNRLLFALLSGYYLFHEAPRPTVFIGAALIIGSNLYLSFLEMRLERNNRATPS